MHMMAAAAAAPPRRRKMIGHRRRVEDEGEDDGAADALDVDDDSLTEGSLASDDNDPADDSDTSNIDEASPTPAKPAGNGVAKPAARTCPADGDTSISGPITETDIMLNGLAISDPSGPPAQDMDFTDVHQPQSPAAKSNGPVIVSSASAPQPQAQPRAPLYERRRREHDEYRRKRDEDPSFVPNRGAFFMHDHRHAGPAANGFRPFPRGGGRGGRGGGRSAFNGGGSLYSPVQHFHPPDPTTNAPWSHDMHEAVESVPPRPPMRRADAEGPANGNGIIPTCPPNPTPINRTMSTEKHIGNVQIRVFFPPLKTPAAFAGVPVKQYTKLPDHRPPLRRDKPVRISLPGANPRYRFPAVDRSFIFIPRAMRPNQQRIRGKGPRSALGSVGGFSRRTSVFGGSYYGSAYSPSMPLSRRSSLAPDLGRDFLVSPTGSAISRPPVDTNPRPVVRLPPSLSHHPNPAMPVFQPAPPDVSATSAPKIPAPPESSINDFPQPQTHPLPQKPTFRENRPTSLPMHQPRPQKAVSVENIESPAQSMRPAQPPYQQAFHQQYPIPAPTSASQLPPDSHARHASFPSQHSTGTPLSQIPERAIHAAPFHPNNTPAYPQPGYYGPPYQQQPQQGYYYPPAYGGNPPPPAAANTPAAAFAAQQQGQMAPYNGQQQQQQQPGRPEAGGGPPPPPGTNPNLVAQEANGMVYYYDASQLPAVAGYPPPPPTFTGAQQGFAPPGVMNMGPGLVTPSPDGYYYPQAPPGGMVYYSQ